MAMPMSKGHRVYTDLTEAEIEREIKEKGLPYYDKGKPGKAPGAAAQDLAPEQTRVQQGFDQYREMKRVAEEEERKRKEREAKK